MSSLARRFAGTIALALLSAGTAHAVPSTQFTLSGVANPGVYDLARLEALPPVTQTVSYTASGVPQTRTYTGTSLWGLLNDASIPTNPAVKNDVLNKYVVATGTDGYKAVLSLGELNPNFGNRPDLVAYAEITNGVSGPIGADGFARITVPGDVRGGRYVSNLASLELRSGASKQSGTGGGVSTSFTVSGDVTAAKTFDLAALQALPAMNMTVNGANYTGISLWTLLTSIVGVPSDAAIRNDLLGKYVVATGSDGYQVIYSLGELDPNFGAQPDFIAYAIDGQSLGNNGFARVVVPNDVRAGRWVSNLVSLEVFTARAVPEPTTAVIVPLGLLALGLARRRNGRAQAAA